VNSAWFLVADRQDLLATITVRFDPRIWDSAPPIGTVVRDRMAGRSGSLGWSGCRSRLIWTDA
jgi:hypothetical protein